MFITPSSLLLCDGTKVQICQVSGAQPYETVFFAQSFAEGVGSRAVWLTCAWESQLVPQRLLCQLGRSMLLLSLGE